MSGGSDRPREGEQRGRNGEGSGDEAQEPRQALPERPERPALPPASSAYLLPAAGRARHARHRVALLILAVSLTLLVVCALPVWAFGLWSAWDAHRYAPPPVLAALDPGGRSASEARWSPDGRYLAEQVTLAGAAAGDPNGAAVVLWDAQARREVRRFTGADGGLTLAWSPDGSWLATTGGTFALLWRAAEIETAGGSVRPVARLEPSQDPPDSSEPISGLAWAPDGRTLAVADEGGLSIWQSAGESGWKQIRYFRDGACATALCGRRLLWSPDGQWLLAAPWHGAGGASGVGVWDAQTWSRAALLDASAALAWAPDSSLVVVRNEDETTLSAVRSGSWQVAWTLDPNANLHQSYRVYPQAAGWSPDGRYLAGSMDGWVSLWPTDTRASAWVWEEQQRDQGIYAATSLAWSPDTFALAVTTDGTARLTLYDMSNPASPG